MVSRVDSVCCGYRVWRSEEAAWEFRVFRTLMGDNCEAATQTMIPPILLRFDVTGLRYPDGASDIKMTRTYNNGKLLSFMFPA
jgi:hypothetical protein